MPLLLKKNKSVMILTVFSPSLLSKSDIKPNEFLRLLENQGFILYDLNEEKMEAEPTTEKEDYTNLLVARNPIT